MSTPRNENSKKTVKTRSKTTTTMQPKEDKSVNPSVNEPNNKHRSKILKIVTVVFLIVALIVFCLWFFHYRLYRYTDDAYANGSMININSVIEGSVIAYYADDTDLVKEGQLLVSLDKTFYQVEYDKELASLKASVLQVKQLYDQVKVSQANYQSKNVLLKKAKYDYNNRALLINSLAVSNEEYTHSSDDLMVAEQALNEAKYQLKVAQDAAGKTPFENHPIIEKQKNVVREAYYNLQHCSIYAPATGYVAQRLVDVGERVKSTSPLMAIIPTDYVWIDANYKETQLTYMRVGQPATVTLDIYGSDVVFEGKVLGIASGSGSVFSLIPPQNATGNWIKIVQRLPVRISLDPKKLKDYPVRLGISAEVNVDISNRDLPMLVQVTSNKPVATTKVFDINFDEVNRVIDEIIGGT